MPNYNQIIRRNVRIVRVYPIRYLLRCRDIMHLILLSLDDVDLCSFLQTNKRCYQLGQKDRFWELRVIQRYPDWKEHPRSLRVSWYHCYIIRPYYLPKLGLINKKRIIEILSGGKYFLIPFLDDEYCTGVIISALIEDDRLDLIKEILVRSYLRNNNYIIENFIKGATNRPEIKKWLEEYRQKIVPFFLPLPPIREDTTRKIMFLTLP